MSKPIYFKDLPIYLKIGTILIIPIVIVIAIIFGLIGFIIGIGLFLCLIVPAVIIKIFKKDNKTEK